ncbi:hypothetical protein ALC57_13379, partial [Trachymyrmex cornetzi]
IQNARRRNKKGRAMGGMIMGIKKELYVTEEIEGEEEEERRSKDSKVNKEGRKLVGFIRQRGGGGQRNGKREVVPVRKKEQGEEVKDYRGVWIMPTLYKIYTAALTERLREEVEGKGLIPPNQTGFRKGLGTMDNIYVWGIGKRKKDWKRRVWLFDKLIWAMVSYGVEIWGWKEREAVGSLQERDREMQRVERWEKIRVSRYNRWYGWIKGEGLPKYLSKGWGEGRRRMVARFRLGNEVKEGRYWEEEERKYRLCRSEWETWEHIWEGCRAWEMGEGGSWQEVVGRILGEEGEEEGWMREVEEERKRMREEGDIGEGKND